MGYYTQYSITSLTAGVDEEQAEQMVLEIIEETYGNPFEDECKWYDHDDDMKKVSLKYPEIIFKLHGEGEESGDIWDKYYKNGKVQKAAAKISYDEFDESKLV
jgi:hypothetical protein